MKITLTRAGLFGLLLILLAFTACEKPPVEVIDDPLLKEQYFVFSIGGLQGFAAVPADTVIAQRSGSTTNLTGIKSDGNTRIFASFNGNAATGTYPLDQLTLLVNSRYYVMTNVQPQAFISHYGNVGDYIHGSYNGQLKDSLSGITYSMNGVFKIRRAN